MNLEIYNSYCALSGDIPQNVSDLVKQVLTYENDIGAEKAMLFGQLNRVRKGTKPYGMIVAKIKKLEETQFVCWFRNNTFPTGHLNIVKECLKATQVQYNIIDHRVVPGMDGFFKWHNKAFDPRYYQNDAINLCLENGRGVIESAVGTGKSLMMAHVLKNLSVNSLIVVPSTGLSAQIYNDFSVWFGPHMVEICNTKKVRSGKALKPIRIITIQSMASLFKSGELQGLVHDINAIYIDEIHHAGSASYTNLLKEIDHIYYRFGFTGTFLRNDSKSLDMWGFLSNVLYRYPAYKAIEEGFLTPIEMNIYELGGKQSRSYNKEYDLNYCGNPDMLNKVYEICAANPNDQVLILVKKKDKAGKIIHEFLQHNGINNSYISGDNSKEEITDHIREFNEKKINVLIGSSVIGEGIDIRSADHLILCQGGKSEIAIVQATGRLVRLFEGKELGYLHDFDFVGTKYMQKHLVQRIDIIQRNFAPQKINRFNW